MLRHRAFEPQTLIFILILESIIYEPGGCGQVDQALGEECVPGQWAPAWWLLGRSLFPSPRHRGPSIWHFTLAVGAPVQLLFIHLKVLAH